jgi:hypothetical protein
MICVYYFMFVLSVACNYRVAIFVPDALMLFELVRVYPWL